MHGVDASVAHGLKAPWGLRPVTTQEFYYWAPTLGAQVVQLRVMAKVAIAATFGEWPGVAESARRLPVRGALRPVTMEKGAAGLQDYQHCRRPMLTASERMRHFDSHLLRDLPSSQRLPRDGQRE